MRNWIVGMCVVLSAGIVNADGDIGNAAAKKQFDLAIAKKIKGAHDRCGVDFGYVIDDASFKNVPGDDKQSTPINILAAGYDAVAMLCRDNPTAKSVIVAKIKKIGAGYIEKGKRSVSMADGTLHVTSSGKEVNAVDFVADWVKKNL